MGFTVLLSGILKGFEGSRRVTIGAIWKIWYYYMSAVRCDETLNPKHVNPKPYTLNSKP